MNAGQIEHFNQLTKTRKLAQQRLQFFRCGSMRYVDLTTGEDCTNEATNRELHMIAGIETTIDSFYSKLT